MLRSQWLIHFSIRCSDSASLGFGSSSKHETLASCVVDAESPDRLFVSGFNATGQPALMAWPVTVDDHIDLRARRLGRGRPR
jgi:hypothetical protein